LITFFNQTLHAVVDGDHFIVGSLKITVKFGQHFVLKVGFISEVLSFVLDFLDDARYFSKLLILLGVDLPLFFE
jgi:hypothetical protein